MPRNSLSAGLFNCYRKFSRSFLRIANRPILSLGIAGLFSLLVSGGVTFFLGVPPPAVHDEYSYWLAADTFAHGRLTNPPHPLWVHFETFHVLQQPTYMSKYPPGQGMALALGQVLTGRPIVGVWLNSALACAAIGWMLRAWVRPRWALLGSLLIALHPLMVDWNHNYWGGSVALFGGALVLGAMRRICPKPEVRNQKPENKSSAFSRFDLLISGFCLGLGMAILANSRPYEGMIVSFLALTTILVAVNRFRLVQNQKLETGNQNTPVASFLTSPFSLLVLSCGSAGLILALTAAWMAYYNWRVTGNPLRMPYSVYQEAYSASPSFLWNAPKPIPEYRHKEIQDFWLNFERPIYEGQQGLAGLLKGAAWKAGVLFHSAFPSIFVLLSLAGLPAVLSRSGWSRFALLFLFLFYLAMIPVVGAIGHYAAPVAGLFFYLIVESLRLLRVWRWSGLRLGRWIVRCIMLGWCLWLVPKIIDMNRFDPDDKCHNQSKERAAILDQMRHEQGKHLVIVRYGTEHSYHAEWVYNEADIDGAEVIWAREMDAEHNQQLLKYFKDRHIWLVEADEIPPRVVPYPSLTVLH
jgi:hypothetical protein